MDTIEEEDMVPPLKRQSNIYISAMATDLEYEMVALFDKVMDQERKKKLTENKNYQMTSINKFEDIEFEMVKLLDKIMDQERQNENHRKQEYPM